MKKRTSLFIIVCLLLLAILPVGTLVFGPSEAGANEILAAAPKFTKEGRLNDLAFRQAANWFDDHVFLRQELITLNAKAQAALGASANEQIVLGKDGWLYYASSLTSSLTDGELKAIAGNLTLIQEYCNQNGIDFQFLCAPNKSTVYPQFLKSPCGESRLPRLLAMLEEAGVSAPNLMNFLAEQPEVIYFAHDSHWNSKGAALAADAILGESRYFSDPFTQREAHTGDLYQMLYPAGVDTETNPVFGGTLSYQFREGSGRQPDSITIRTESSGEGSLLMYRDSFGNSLYPYLASYFGKATFSRAASYDLTLTQEEKPDTIILELVERNLSCLLRNVPLMEAPRRSLALPPARSTIALEHTTSPKFPGHTLWQGKAAVDSPVYLAANGTVYSCFRTEAGGFAAWLPEGEAVTEVLWYEGDTLCAHTVQ